MTEIQNDTDQVWSIGEFYIRICFGFRASDFEFINFLRLKKSEITIYFSLKVESSKMLYCNIDPPAFTFYLADFI